MLAFLVHRTPPANFGLSYQRSSASIVKLLRKGRRDAAPSRGIAVAPQLSADAELRPQRWLSSFIINPLDRSLSRLGVELASSGRLIGLRYFWFDGLFATMSDNFYITFIPLFALAYNASSATIGIMTAVANLLGTVALFPGARLAERSRFLKPIVVASGGMVGRLVLIVLIAFPFFTISPALGVLIIIAVNAVRSFTGNFGNPAWTALAAELVPSEARGRYFGMRNTIMGVAALATAPFAGWIIEAGNRSAGMPHFGYQLLFLMALITGMSSTYCYNRIPEPQGVPLERRAHRKGDLRRTLATNRAFTGLVASAFVWNLALQTAGPFFNVYLVTKLNGSDATVGTATGIANLTNLVGLFVFSRLIDRKGNKWVVRLSGFIIPLLPLSWVFMKQIWEVYLNNVFSGFLWAGYNLASFNLLLELTPDEQRPRAVAFYQTVVFTAAVIGPALGGYLADVASFKSVFTLSFVGRYLAMFIFVWLVRERPGSKPSR